MSLSSQSQAGGEPPTDLSFTAFYDRHQKRWLKYAYAETGSLEAAEQIVDGVTLHVAGYWPDIQQMQSAAWHAWKVLKATVARWLDEHGTESAFVETAAFDQVRRALARFRHRFAGMEDSLGMFAALEDSLGLFSTISRLPARQYEAVVLHHVLGYQYDEIASTLGVSTNTVRVSMHNAMKCLTEEMIRRRLIQTNRGVNRAHR